jgi:hypothetical protein
MNGPQRRRVLGIVCAVLLSVGAGWSLSAQTPAKKPISYDVMDYWRSIGGTRLSRDGQWLSYALTSQGEDGVLIVRNLKSGQEQISARHERAVHAGQQAGDFHDFCAARGRERGAGC